MSQVKKNRLSFALRIIADTMLGVAFLVMVSLPFARNQIVEFFSGGNGAQYESDLFILVFLYVFTVLFSAIVFVGRFILRTLENGNPFDRRNAIRFMMVGVLSVLICILFCVKIVMYNTLSTMAAAVLFALIAFIAFILSNVFAQAADIWEDHQLTV